MSLTFDQCLVIYQGSWNLATYWYVYNTMLASGFTPDDARSTASASVEKGAGYDF